MTILSISDITRKENFIYYRREFTGKALYDLPGRQHAGQIEFIIETTPMGKKQITINLVDSVEYPVLPLIHSLKDFIMNMDNEGKLP